MSKERFSRLNIPIQNNLKTAIKIAALEKGMSMQTFIITILNERLKKGDNDGHKQTKSN